MTDPMMYCEDMYVFLSPDEGETFMTPLELLAKLKQVLASYPGELPRELQSLASNDERAKYLIETHCEFETSPGVAVQWYAVRLEK